VRYLVRPVDSGSVVRHRKFVGIKRGLQTKHLARSSLLIRRGNVKQLVDRLKRHRERRDLGVHQKSAIRIPITVMERAGFGAHEKTQEMLLGGYGKFMRIAMALILSFLALILGVKVPWKEIVTGIINAILK
jgi:hypothetical protein